MGKRKQNFRNNHEFEDTALVNSMTYNDYLIRFRQLALSQFEWVNLPESMNPVFLEMCLYYFGQASLLKTQDYGFINTKCVSNGKLNIYGLPTSFNCFSYDFSETRKLYTGLIEGQTDTDCCILVRNNWDRIPTARYYGTFCKTSL